MRVKQSALELIKSVIEESFSAFPDRLIYVYIYVYPDNFNAGVVVVVLRSMIGWSLSRVASRRGKCQCMAFTVISKFFHVMS